MSNYCGRNRGTRRREHMCIPRINIASQRAERNRKSLSIKRRSGREKKKKKKEQRWRSCTINFYFSMTDNANAFQTRSITMLVVSSLQYRNNLVV
ncbi:hypothetical protein PUN28_015579 [Cardiocondyla obscurior]|uniref:Uncharacterized protein n=1 Tax=Cardiocondyla obscurior TaxID=286306 RepID=A0AAW2ETX2_9HYME